MSSAFAAWNTDSETLEDVEARIHDGVPREDLTGRGARYISLMFSNFPSITGYLKDKPRVLEIGPGVGYLLEAVHERLPSADLHGLDVSRDMIAMAKRRLARDGLDGLAEFHHYDGRDTGFPDKHFDLVYSCATLQHIPKPYVYLLLTEIQRISKSCILHFLHWDHLSHQQSTLPFQQEALQQVEGRVGHWHHFYDEIELGSIFKNVLGARDFTFSKPDTSIWVGGSWHKP